MKIRIMLSAIVMLAMCFQPSFASPAAGVLPMSTALQFNLSELDIIASQMGNLANLPTDELLDAAGHEVEAQTVNRLANEKTSPDGDAWPTWSDSYAQSRHSGHGLLESDGDLIRSIQSLPANDSVEVGSNLAYAAHQHFGSEGEGGLPARPYLGLSDGNRQDLNAVIEDFLQQSLAAL